MVVVPCRDLYNLGLQSEPRTPLLAFCSQFVTSLPHNLALLPGQGTPPAQQVSLHAPIPGSLHTLQAGEQGSLQTLSSRWAPQDHVAEESCQLTWQD